MWKEINVNEKCSFLRSNSNSLYTIPDILELEYNPVTRSETDITYYRKDNNKPQILIKKDWNDRGLWETNYYRWED